MSLCRVNNYLKGDEIDDDSISHIEKRETISIENGSFSWAKGEESTIQNINLSVKKKELVAIVGRVGAGKSSLLSALLGNMFKNSGKGKIKY